MLACQCMCSFQIPPFLKAQINHLKKGAQFLIIMDTIAVFESAVFCFSLCLLVDLLARNELFS